MLKKISGSIWAIIEYIWYPILLFVSTPYFIKNLGTEQYGLWMLLTATTSFGSVMNTGTGAATIKKISASRSGVGSENIKSIISASLVIALLGGGLLAMVIFSVFGLWGNVFFSKMGTSSLVFLTGGVAALLVWIEQVDNVFSSVLKGAEKFKHAAGIEIASKTTQILVALVAVSTWGGMHALYTALIIVAMIRLIEKYWLVGRLLDFSVVRLNFFNVLEMFHFAKWGWLQGIGGVFFGVADKILIGSLLGASDLTHYSIATQMAQQIHGLSSAGMSVIFPRVSRRLEENENFSLLHITKLAMACNFFVSSFLALGLLVFGKQILVLWLGELEEKACISILLYLIVAYWILAINMVPYYLLLSLGRVRFIGITCVLAGLISIVAMYWTLLVYGLVGSVVGRLAYGIITLILLCPLLQHIFHQQKKRN